MALNREEETSSHSSIHLLFSPKALEPPFPTPPASTASVGSSALSFQHHWRKHSPVWLLSYWCPTLSAVPGAAALPPDPRVPTWASRSSMFPAAYNSDLRSEKRPLFTSPFKVLTPNQKRSRQGSAERTFFLAFPKVAVRDAEGKIWSLSTPLCKTRPRHVRWAILLFTITL